MKTFKITTEYEGKYEILDSTKLEETLLINLEISNNLDDFLSKVTYSLTDSTSSLNNEDLKKLETYYNHKIV